MEVKIEMSYSGKTKKYPTGGRIGSKMKLINPSVPQVAETCSKLHSEMVEEILDGDPSGINWNITWTKTTT